jgi:acyl carrier protein
MYNDAFPQQVRSFVTDNYLYGQEKQFDDGDSFLEHGIIDSTAVLELVAFLEENYGITVEDDELTPDNLDSINSVSAYLRRKLNGAAETFSPAAQTA